MQCTPDSHSDIGVLEEEEDARTGKHGKDLEKRTHPFCEICERDVMVISLKSHKAHCKHGDESDIAVVDEDTEPRCEYCRETVEQSEYVTHVRKCGISDDDSDWGIPDDGRISGE